MLGSVRLLDGVVRVSASDLSNFLACRHLTRLDAAVAKGLVAKPHLKDVGFEQLVKRGEDHERGVLAGFRAKGWDIREIPSGNDDEAVQQTLVALDAGVEVVYQGALRDGDRFGLPDLVAL
jgi:uncharacterized protein